jgi:hypothetical protein
VKSEKNHHRITDTDADMESTAGNESLGEAESAAHDSRCSITVTSYRHRNHDTDGISIKAALDGLVARKILPDDSAKEIKEIRFLSIIQRDIAEKTVIEIEYATDNKLA